MKALCTYVCCLSLAILSCRAQEVADKINIVIPSIEQEASSVWRTIRDIQFFERAGYTINLPNDPLIDSLIQKCKNGNFGNADFSSIYQLLEDKVFKASDYQAAYQKVKSQKNKLNLLIQEIARSKDTWDWDFLLFDSYDVIFTLYGSGGSFDPESAKVILYTNPKGQFKNYKNPANTILHEIVHIGMEKSLVQKWQVSHIEKEKLVDSFVYFMFREELPEYTMQEMGEQRLGALIKGKEDLQKLNHVLENLSR